MVADVALAVVAADVVTDVAAEDVYKRQARKCYGVGKL